MNTSKNRNVTQIIRMNRQLNRGRLSNTAIGVRHTLARRNGALIVNRIRTPTFNRRINYRRTRIISHILVFLTQITRSHGRPGVQYRVHSSSYLTDLRARQLCLRIRVPMKRVARNTNKINNNNKRRTRLNRTRSSRRNS